MKIGAVCEQTGLSDRTVRFYTDEGLLSPSYTKNYLGRKTFDFSEADVAMLKSIAVLRKYGFSIPEIKAILEDPAKSVEIIASLREKKQTTIRTEQELLDVLLTLEADKAYTVPELAEALNTPKLEETKLPDEEDDSCLTVLCSVLFWWLTGPTALVTIFALPLMLWDTAGTFLHIKNLPESSSFIWAIIGMQIPIVAAAAMIVLDSRRGRMDGAVRQLLAIILTICHLLFGMPLYILSAIGVVAAPKVYSETEDPADYLIVGSLEQRTLGENLELLFPEKIPEYALGEEGKSCPETTRYYNYVDGTWGCKYELYAQWQLTDQDLEAEKQRIQEAFPEEIKATGQLGQWEYWSLKMDPEACVDDPLFYQYADYLYFFFAFQEETGMVRYIASYASEYPSTPGFCSLDWN